MNEGRAIIIFYEIIKVIENLHRKNVIHRDLKAANIVLNRRSYKIILTNFSLGKQLLNENDLLNDKVGTPNYISPDVLSHQPYRGKPSDMWALGVVFYMMIYGELPFFERNTTDLFKKIRMGDYKMPESDTSSEVKKLIKDILQVNPVPRLTATQVRERLEKMITAKLNRSNIHLDLIVPDIDTMAMEPEEEEPAGPSFKPFSTDLNLSFSQWLKCQKARKGPLFGSMDGTMGGMNQLMNKDNKTTVFLLKPKIAGTRYVPPNVPTNSAEFNLISAVNGPTLSSMQTASSASSSTPSLRHDVIESITEALNEHFLRNRQTDTENRQLIAFNGVITQELSQKMYDWLRAEFANNPILRFFVSNTNPNKFEKIKEFLVNMCVNIQCVVNDCLVLKRQQSRDILIILNYIFKNVGYRTAYFLPMSNLRPFSYV